MSDRRVTAVPLTAAAFAAYGDVIEATGAPSFGFNGGMADRYHDLARTEVLGDGRLGVSIATARPYALPLELTLVERHPLGSQAFVPLGPDPFLVVVAEDRDGKPGKPAAFLTRSGQGVNYLRNTWHGVLTPLHRAAPFLVVDRIGSGPNLEEYVFERSWIVEA